MKTPGVNFDKISVGMRSKIFEGIQARASAATIFEGIPKKPLRNPWSNFRREC